MSSRSQQLPAGARFATLVAVAVPLALALAVLAMPSRPASATAGPGPGAAEKTLKFGLGPARAVPKGQYVDGRAYLTYVANPGATISDEVVVLNYGARPLELEVYATDATQGTDGAFGLLPGIDKPTDAGTWIKLDVPADHQVMVPGRKGDRYGTLRIPFVASVPAKASPGDHVGGVVASLQVEGKNKKGAKITLDQRIALRTYFQVTGNAVPALAIEHLTAGYDDQHDPLGRGRVTVSYVVHNTGDLRLDASQDVSVSRWLVGSVNGYPAALEDILPGSRIEVTQVFDHTFGLGPLTAHVTLHPTAVDEAYRKAMPEVSAQQQFWAWPWVLLAIGGGLLLLILLLWMYRRWRKHRARKALEGGSGQGAAPAPREPAVVSRQSLRRT